MKKKRYAIVGASGRAFTYAPAVLGKFSRTSELVGLCDISQVHMASSMDAARSVLIGVAATGSMENDGARVKVADLLKGK